ncbi:unnamed protein product, partial [Effrenium voratum]
ALAFRETPPISNLDRVGISSSLVTKLFMTVLQAFDNIFVQRRSVVMMLCAAYSLLQATPKDTGLLPALNGVELLEGSEELTRENVLAHVRSSHGPALRREMEMPEVP